LELLILRTQRYSFPLGRVRGDSIWIIQYHQGSYNPGHPSAECK